MNDLKEKISSNIKNVGAIMTIVIIIYHSHFLDSSSAISSLDATLADKYYSYLITLSGVAMSFFFFVTGYLLFKNLTLSTYAEKIKRRVKSLFVPYLAWQPFGVVSCILCGDGITKAMILKGTFLFDKWPPDGALWYVYVVFVLAILSPLFMILLKNKKIGIVSVFLITIGANYLVRSSNEQIIAIVKYGYVTNILYYISSYVLGCFYGKFYSNNPSYSDLKIFVILLLVLAVCGNLQTAFIFPVFLVYLSPKHDCKFIRNVSKLQFLMYASHGVIGGIISLPFNALFVNNIKCVIVNNLVCAAIMIAIVYFICNLVYKLLNKISPSLLAILTGGR